jgi:uncharacterized protein (DUF433 family)
MPARKRQTGRQAAGEEVAKQIGRYIVADPRICHGKLTFRGTRILVADVLDQVASGMPWERILEEWRGSIPTQAIAEAVQLAKETFVQHADEYTAPVYGRRKTG